MAKGQQYINGSGGLFLTTSPTFVEVPGTRIKYTAIDSGDIDITLQFTHISTSLITFSPTLLIGSGSGSFIPYTLGAGVANSSTIPQMETFSQQLRTTKGQEMELALMVKVFSGLLAISVANPPQITIITEI